MPDISLHSPAEVIRQLLVDQGLGTNPGGIWPVFDSALPDLPDNCIAVKDRPGTEDGRSMITGELFVHYGFMVFIRSKDHPLGWVKASALRTALAEGTYQEPVTVDDTHYLVHCISRIGAVLPLGYETPTSRRNLFTINAAVSLKQIP